MPLGTDKNHLLAGRPGRGSRRARALLALAALAMPAASALAQLPAGVYKCRTDTGIVFQGQPCPGDLGRVSGTQPASGATAAPSSSVQIATAAMLALPAGPTGPQARTAAPAAVAPSLSRP